MGFSQLLGNEHLKAQLSAAFAHDKLSHCFLLTGPEGSGKHTLARLLAAAMECEGKDRPCCACAACRKALSDIHPDVITVDTPERKTVPVERIRALQADAYIRPNEGARKVYLLPRAQALTESAQNALLKLIEEPPPYGVFLLITDNPEKLLPTVRSRCQLLRLSPLSPAQALPALQERFPGRDEATLLSALRQGGGYLGPAAALLEDEALAQETAALVKALAAGILWHSPRFWPSWSGAAARSSRRFCWSGRASSPAPSPPAPACWRPRRPPRWPRRSRRPPFTAAPRPWIAAWRPPPPTWALGTCAATWPRN